MQASYGCERDLIVSRPWQTSVRHKLARGKPRATHRRLAQPAIPETQIVLAALCPEINNMCS